MTRRSQQARFENNVGAITRFSSRVLACLPSGGRQALSFIVYVSVKVSLFLCMSAGENPQDGGFQQQQTVHGDVLPEL